MITDATVIATERDRDAVRTNLSTVWVDRWRRQRHATAQLALGHWHSHPSGSPDPSQEDFALWEQLLEKSRDRRIYLRDRE